MEAVVTESPVPSLADLAKQALEAKKASDHATKFADAQHRWSQALSAAGAEMRRVFGRDADSIDRSNAPRPTDVHYFPVDYIYLKIEKWWIAFDPKKGTLTLATDKCILGRKARLSACGKEFDDLASFALALEWTVDGVIPKPGTTSHWHFDDAGHLISCSGYERESSYWPTWVDRTTDANGLLPNGVKPIPYED